MSISIITLMLMKHSQNVTHLMVEVLLIGYVTGIHYKPGLTYLPDRRPTSIRQLLCGYPQVSAQTQPVPELQPPMRTYRLTEHDPRSVMHFLHRQSHPRFLGVLQTRRKVVVYPSGHPGMSATPGTIVPIATNSKAAFRLGRFGLYEQQKLLCRQDAVAEVNDAILRPYHMRRTFVVPIFIKRLYRHLDGRKIRKLGLEPQAPATLTGYRQEAVLHGCRATSGSRPSRAVSTGVYSESLAGRDRTRRPPQLPLSASAKSSAVNPHS